MSFKLTNTPATFIDIINTVFIPYVDTFVIIFMDDILIYLKNEKDRVTHLRMVLQTLKYKELFVKFSKCECWLENMVFLGNIVFGNSTRVDTQTIA